MFSVWLLTVIIVLAISLSVWSYLNYASLPTHAKYTLTLLRVCALLVLFVLFLNPQFERTQTLISVPSVTVLVDETQSIAIEKAQWNGQQDMQTVLGDIDASLSELDAEVNWRGFSRSSESIDSYQQLQFDKSGTDIYSVLTEYDQESDAEFVILVSDGISTTGRDPAFAGRMMNRPVFTVAVGDTTTIRDIVLQRVDYPRNAFINSATVITATIRNDGFIEEQLEVVLRSGNDILEQKSIVTGATRSTHQVEFTVESEDDGLQPFTLEVLPIEGEWTTLNNTRNFSIHFADDLTRILYLAYEVHPDVGAFRKVLETNPSVQVTPRTWIRDDNFIEGTLPAAIDTFDMVIVHGLPGSEVAQLRLKSILEANSSLLLLTPMVTSSTWTNVTDGLVGRPSIRVDRSVQGVQLRPSSEQSGHPILSLPPVELNRTPPLQSPVAGISASTAGTNLLYATFRGEPTTTPLLSILQTGNMRNAYLVAYGFNQWFLQGDENQQAWMDALLTNLVNWVAADVQSGLFEISTILSEFDTGEAVQFIADVRDESGNPESNAEINVRVVSQEVGVNRDFSMQPSGRGRYALDIGALPEGIYTYQADARVGTQQLGSQSGTFQVGNAAVELLNTQRNDAALQQIAQGSGAVFFTYENLRDFTDTVNEALELRSTTDQRIPAYLNRSPIWLVLLLLLLTAEWLYRKRLALP